MLKTRNRRFSPPMAVMTARAQELKAQGLLNSRGELLLYGIIGDWWDGMDAFTIVRELEALDTDDIHVRIHSRGGLITEGLAMYNALSQAAKPVRVSIDGVCASMATVVATAASPGQLYTPPNALWMVHKPWGMAEGNAEDMREYANNLDVLEQSLIAAYTAGGRVSEERIREILASGKDYYLTGAEAVEQGFADELLEPVQAAAAINMDKMPTPDSAHRALFDFYAVNAAHHPRNDEETTMLKAKLLKLKAALTEQGVAAGEIDKALATAFGIQSSEVKALLADDGKPTDAQLKAGIDALDALKANADNTPGHGDNGAAGAQNRGGQHDHGADRATQPGHQPGGDAGQDAQAAIATERRRVADITALASRHGLPDQARTQLITDGATLEQARAQALDYLATQDGQRQPSPGIRLHDASGESFQASVANAMMNRMQPGRFKLEEGGRDFRGMNLLDMAAQCLERAGVSTRGLTRNELAAKALHTTSDFPDIVADVANKVLLSSYQAQPRTFTQVANQASISDFKAKHAIEIGGGSELKEVGEGGEFEHGTVSEGKRSYKLDTFGRIFALSRQLLINDDIGAFNQFLSNIGALAARKESSVVWSLVKTGAIYSSGNGNLVSSGGAVNDTQLSNVRKLLRKQKGLDDEPINVSGRFLVVNSERETEAQKQLAAIMATASGDVNPFANSLELIVEPLLDGVANDPWYIFADPMLVPALEYAYLEGEGGPYIETKNGFEVDGIQIKVRHDFGAGWVAHRGTVKNPGA